MVAISRLNNAPVTGLSEGQFPGHPRESSRNYSKKVEGQRLRGGIFLTKDDFSLLAGGWMFFKAFLDFVVERYWERAKTSPQSSKNPKKTFNRLRAGYGWL